MPTLSLHFPEKYLSEEFADDALIVINAEREKVKQTTFTDFKSYLRHGLREWCLGAIRNMTHYENKGEYMYLGEKRKGVFPLWVDLNPYDQELMDDGLDGNPYSLVIGKTMFEVLKQALIWENTWNQHVVVRPLYVNVVEIARDKLLDYFIQLEIDITRIELETEERIIEKAEKLKG